MHITTIGKYTALEALRTRVPATTLLTLALLVCASVFVRELAITETARFQTAFYASAARFCAVFLTGIYVLASMSREFSDKGLEVVLALDVPRSHYICGKLAGFMAAALLIGAVISLPVWLWAAPLPALFWSLSLLAELALIAALALFCVVTFSQMLPAAGFVAAFYLLARSITAMRLMGAHPVAGSDSWSQLVMTGLVEAMAYVIPPLDQWTATTWLVDTPPSASLLGGILLQALLYLSLLIAATLFDFHRRSL